MSGGLSGGAAPVPSPLPPAAILARLLAVDGAGSGLDADLLDGQHGSYYRDAGNINAGTLAAARGGTGVSNAGTITNASNTTITGGGTLALGGFTLTVPATGTTVLLGTAQTMTAAKVIALGTLTDPSTPLAITATWNDAADTFDALTVDITNTNSAAASRLLRLTVGGAARFYVDRSGVAVGLGGAFGDATSISNTTQSLIASRTGGNPITIYNNATGADPATSGTTQTAAAHVARFGLGAVVLDWGMRFSGNFWMQASLISDLSTEFPIEINPNGGAVIIGTDPGGSDLFRIGGALCINSATMIQTKTSFTNGAGASAGTLTNAPSIGNPTKWVSINDNGTTRYIPAW